MDCSPPSSPSFAIELVRDRLVRMTEVPELSPPAGYVRIRTAWTGVCGSDLSTWQGRHPYKRAPAVLGHEFAGIVDALGPGSHDWALGDRVCAMAYRPCDRCSACRAGRPNLCPDKKTFSHGGWPGSFASHVLAHEAMLFRLPDVVGDDVGAVVEPLAIGLHALRQAGPLECRSLAIIGSGSVGLACTLSARRLGVEHITCIDINGEKRSLALACGADTFIQPLLSKPDGKFEIVIVACDYPGAVDDAIALASPGGRVVIVSYFGSDVSLAANALVRAEISIAGSALADRQDFAQIIAWLADGTFDPQSMITHRMKLAELNLAFELMTSGAGDVGKILLKP